MFRLMIGIFLSMRLTMFNLHYLRFLTITALTLMLTVAPLAFAMENDGEPTNESTNAPVLFSLEDIKDFCSRHRRGIALFINVGLGAFFLKTSFDQNNDIYAANDLWLGEMRQLLQNCTCGPVQIIHSDVQEAAFYSNISSAFIVISTAGKLLSFVCHCWVGDALASHFNLAFLVCDAVGLSTGSLANSHLLRAKDLLRSTMPAALGNAIKKALDACYYLAIPAGQISYQLLEFGYDCFQLCKKEPPEEASVEETDQQEQDER